MLTYSQIPRYVVDNEHPIYRGAKSVSASTLFARGNSFSIISQSLKTCLTRCYLKTFAVTFGTTTTSYLPRKDRRKRTEDMLLFLDQYTTQELTELLAINRFFAQLALRALFSTPIRGYGALSTHYFTAPVACHWPPMNEPL
jgi:hypothetical protein